MHKMRRQVLPQKRKAHELNRHVSALSMQGLRQVRNRREAMSIEILLCPECGGQIEFFDLDM